MYARAPVFVWIYIFSSTYLYVSFAKNLILYTEGTDCNKEIKLGAATVYSHYRPDTKSTYPHDLECKITFIAEREHWKLMIQFEYLDIPDYLYNGVCSDGVYVYDSNTVGERAFRVAGSNNGLCGKDKPALIESTGPYITIFFRTNSDGTLGKGFKFQITSFSEASVTDGGLPMCGQDFYCRSTSRCIEGDLTCDRVNHCTDGADEQMDGDSKCNPVEKNGVWDAIAALGTAGFIGIIVGGILVFVLFIVCIICTCRRCGKVPNETDHRQSIPSSTHGSIGMQANTQMSNDGILYHQVPQVAPQIYPQMMNHALNQYKLEPKPAYGHIQSLPNQHMAPLAHQRAGCNAAPQPPMEMQMAYSMPSHQAVPLSAPGYPMPPYNYTSPFHPPRGESQSYSSGYSSQQGMVGGSFQPMHTKPIMPQRGYTPTSGSSRSSNTVSDSDVTYSKTDNQPLHNKLQQQDNRPRLPVAL